MHWVAVSLAGLSFTATFLVGPLSPASAARPPDKRESCNVFTNVCTVVAYRPSRNESSPSFNAPDARHASRGNSAPKAVNPCRVRAAVPQPAKADPVWDGHRDGAILVQPCWLLPQLDGRPFWAPPGPGGAGDPIVSPEQLARQALARLRIPRPVIHRSPAESSTDAGVPVTWANLWTWVWTSSSSWRALSRTASVGAVWATVTVKPMVLVFDPGLGGAPVSCSGPGRAWTEADGNSAPADGGCGYVYRSVGTRVRASLAIRWGVSWTGSGGTSGQLPAMTTQATDSFQVQQMQVVNR